VTHKQWLLHTKRNVVHKTFVVGEELPGQILCHAQELVIRKGKVLFTLLNTL